MYEHPDRAPSSVWAWVAMLAAAAFAMTLAGTTMCAIVAGAVIVTRNPVALAAAATLAILVGGFTAGTIARWLRP